MSRAGKYILFVFFLILVIDLRLIVSAEEAATEEAATEEAATEKIIERPVVKYEAKESRDPFKSLLLKEEKKVVSPEGTDLPVPELDLSKLEVQGIIWGGKLPQVIINNKVLTIGDLIEGAEILSIEKNGVALDYNDEVLDLFAPGKNTAQAKVDKEDE